MVISSPQKTKKNTPTTKEAPLQTISDSEIKKDVFLSMYEQLYQESFDKDRFQFVTDLDLKLTNGFRVRDYIEKHVFERTLSNEISGVSFDLEQMIKITPNYPSKGFAHAYFQSQIIGKLYEHDGGYIGRFWTENIIPYEFSKKELSLKEQIQLYDEKTSERSAMYVPSKKNPFFKFDDGMFELDFVFLRRSLLPRTYQSPREGFEEIKKIKN